MACWGSPPRMPGSRVRHVRQRAQRSGRDVGYDDYSRRRQRPGCRSTEDGWMAGNGHSELPFAAVEAKIQHPVHREGLIARTRLLKALAATPERISLVLVIAPAGYGKTTALSQWAADDSR